MLAYNYDYSWRKGQEERAYSKPEGKPNEFQGFLSITVYLSIAKIIWLSLKSPICVPRWVSSSWQLPSATPNPCEHSPSSILHLQDRSSENTAFWVQQQGACQLLVNCLSTSAKYTVWTIAQPWAWWSQQAAGFQGVWFSQKRPTNATNQEWKTESCSKDKDQLSAGLLIAQKTTLEKNIWDLRVWPK